MSNHLTLAFDPADPQDLGDYLRVLIRRRGVQHAEVCRAAGISKSLLSSVLSGKAQAKPTVKKLAEYLSVDPQSLFPSK